MQFLMSRIFSPHLLLAISCALYIVFGAMIFQRLEGQRLKEVRDEQIDNIKTSSDKYIDSIWELATKNADKLGSEEELVEFVKEKTRPNFDNYVDTDAPTWDFKTAVFFTSTLLTSIGYGFVVPSTFEGRLFGIIYSLIGIPLTLVTVANIAKFISERLFDLHYNFWKWMMQMLRKETQDLRPEGNLGLGTLFADDEDEAVCFGDLKISSHNTWPTLVFVLAGVILSTMSMDIVGRMYLKEIHYLGRKLQSNNPFYLLREAKAKRRRAVMASLLTTLARGMIFSHKDYHELARKRSRRKRERRGSHMLPNDKFLFARQPPDPPSDCQVISTSAYSVRLAWASAFTTEDTEITYNVRYRLKHYEDAKIRWLRGIKSNAVEIMSVDSCSLYEFRITAVSKYGESKPVYLVQYTEPQLSPQHILATKLSANTIELQWEPPYKRTHDVKNYIVYFTENPNASLSEWEKVAVHGRKVLVIRIQSRQACVNIQIKKTMRPRHC
ncbi:hypothetical protein WR25_23987 [Diploscapter pachys]|uniref:Fibronectin type-III domain-containing protein n=1 Tax=Diploscapter pachys TaxID=2018661 RepID=A0A2A2L009_9BILA|nr:hypothetical protein WR25_23987 [Diploscapter pachys]